MALNSWSSGDRLDASDLNDNFTELEKARQVLLTVGEDIDGSSTPQASIIGTGLEFLKETVDTETTTENIHGVNIASQKITTSSLIKSISAISFKLKSSTSYPSSIDVSIRADDGSGKPTGANLVSKSVSVAMTTTATFFKFTFASPLSVSPNTDYHILVTGVTGLSDDVVTKANAAGQGTNKSTDSGSTWNAINGKLDYKLYQINTEVGKVYKSNASLDNEKVNNFIGFIIDNVTNGNTGNIVLGGILGGFTGLTIGSVYYLQNTAGTIGISAGTVSKKIGIAISTTQLLIKNDN